MPKPWRLPRYDAAQIDDLSRAAGISPVVAQVLLARGVDTVEAARRFLHPTIADLRPPETLPGAMDVAQHLWDAIGRREKIVVYGDYDADGLTATAILYRAIKHLNGDVSHYIPSRADEGYGLREQVLQRLAGSGVKCVVTVDCGINSTHEALVARDLGLTLLITDHHTPGAELPEAVAIAHPLIGSSPAPFVEFCGALVAFKVAWALGNLANSGAKVSAAYRKLLLEAVGLATIGTIADVMPLVDENRFLVTRGLTELRDSPTVGVRALLQGIDKLASRTSLASDDVGFQLAPRLNAAGRMGQEKVGMELLITEDSKRAVEMVWELETLNERRKAQERQMMGEAHQKIKAEGLADDAALVLFDHDWHAGVLGIVAGRLAEEFHRPVVMLAKNSSPRSECSGSARSVPGVPLLDILKQCTQYLLRFGGHAQAAGVTLGLDREEREAFRHAFVAGVEEVYAAYPERRFPHLDIDAEMPFSAIGDALLTQLDSLRPFGAGNRQPLLCTTEVVLDEPPRQTGKDGTHFAAVFRQGTQKLRGFAFSAASWIPQLTPLVGQPLDIAFHVVRATYSGQVELRIKDWRSCAGTEAPEEPEAIL